MTLRVAVDFGTSSTCVVAAVDGREPQVVVIDGQPLLPSAVYAAPDGSLFVGHEAERQAAVDPSRYEPHPKRRIDEGELLLGATVLPVRDVIHAVLRRATGEARRLVGGAEADLLALTHPADWGVMRTRTLRQAAAGLAREVTLIPEPVAAAVFHGATFRPPATGSERTVEFSGSPGDVLAVLDLGGGTIDVSVVRHELDTGGGFRVLSTKGDPSFGGADIDQLLLEQVGKTAADADADAWRRLMEGHDLSDRRRRRVLRQDVRGAKETLSRHAYTDVPMPPPFSDAHVTRADLERLIYDALGRAVALIAAAVEEAGLKPKHLVGIFLVGGSSRIPLVARLVHERFGLVPTTLDQPETVVARGAMRAVQVSAAQRAPDRRAMAPQAAPHVPPAWRRPVAVPQAGHPPGSAAEATQRILPPVAPPAVAEPAQRRRKVVWQVGGVLVLVAVITVAVFVVVNGVGSNSKKAEPKAGANTISEFGYTFEYPDDWQRTDRRQEDKQVAVRPSGALDGPDFVSVQQFDLSYEVEGSRDRFLRELKRALDAESGRDFTEIEPDMEFAGRSVIHYVERGEEKAVDWFVLAEKRIQVSIGCQWTRDGKERVKSACEEVVRTLAIGG